MKIVPFKAEHLHTLELQDAQRYFVSHVSSAEYGASIEQSGYAFTVMHEDAVLVCFGCVEVWEDRATAWTLVSKHAGPHMLVITRIISGALLAAKWRRVEAYVDAGFDAGMRWLKVLGFHNETPDAPMRAYRPDGGDCFMFSRIK